MNKDIGESLWLNPFLSSDQQAVVVTHEEENLFFDDIRYIDSFQWGCC